MKSTNKAFNQALFLAPCLVLSACGGGSGTNSTAGGSSTSSFSLSLTDGPVDTAQQVIIEFDAATLKPADGDEITFEFDPAISLDLLDLTGSTSTVIVNDEEIPAGEYNWVRLAVNAEFDSIMDSYIILEDGSQFELSIPSGSERGLQVGNGFTASAGGNLNFTIDFDLKKSVSNPGGQPGLFLRPTLRLIDNTLAGSLSGSIDSILISDACDNASENDGAVYLFEGASANSSDISGIETDPLTTALVESDGTWTYEIGFIPEGEYTAAYTCDNELDDPELVDSLTFYSLTTLSITANMNTVVNFN